MNPTAQANAQTKALDEIATIISRCTLREILYHQRYESGSCQISEPTVSDPHTIYKDGLRALYIKILGFQVTSICHLSENVFARAANDVRKSNDWGSKLDEIKLAESRVLSLEQQWRDMKFDEENKKLVHRHEQRMQGLTAIKDEVSRIAKLIQETTVSNERSDLLNWLSSVDPSINYNSARRKQTLSTGDWLVKENHDFKNWEKSPNSMIWLNGKGNATI